MSARSMNLSRILAIACALGPALLSGQSNSSSATYDLLLAPLEGGGGVATSSSYQSELTVGATLGGAVSAPTGTGTVEKPNFVGQLYDVQGVQVSSSSPTIAEESSGQLFLLALMDDQTLVSPPATDIDWSIVLGPLAGIDSAGLVTASLVYTDTPATARGSYLGVSGDVELTILESEADNLGTYAGDGLDDAWQVTHFGFPPNAEAAPFANPDNDPHDNQFEALTGYDPTDSGSFFTLEIASFDGVTATLELSKVIPGTRYLIERSADLTQSDPFDLVQSFTFAAEVLDQELVVPTVTGPRGFYRVGVESAE